jgi:ribosomal protein S18 acetylase RimI-like enzyme
MIVIKRITAEDAFIFRGVRLRALKDSPTAFSSTYAKESKLPDEECQRRAAHWNGENGIGLLAMDKEYACGLVFCFREEQDPEPKQDRGRGDIVSMWVDPQFRRSGVGKELIDAVAEWAADSGIGELKLMVTSVNKGATAFYERLGFTMTGVTGPYPNDPAITEYEMMRQLRGD